MIDLHSVIKHTKVINSAANRNVLYILPHFWKSNILNRKKSVLINSSKASAAA